ncbi:MAG TPA: hypothetical protein VK137_08815 [Planctomycetaceae bacterium]|nr:hypothetical protein [Planctomycetaceae bacterium]
MAYYEDLSPCDYFGGRCGTVLRSVGWLERGKSYCDGRVDEDVFRKLELLLRDAWQPVATAGLHDCDLCAITAEKSGTKNLFIPSDGYIFVCPELITHYINAHHYQPPDSFCKAVVDCPTMRSMAYHKKLLACGGHILIEPPQVGDQI